MMRLLVHIMIGGVILLLSGCTGMRHVTVADPLFTGSEVKFIDHSGSTRKLTPIINNVLKPNPNKKLLWMRPAVARYNMLSDSARTRKFWKNKVAAPVLISETNPEQVAAAIQNRMFHSGYFNNTVATEKIFSGVRKAKYIYSITLREPYQLNTISFPNPQNDLTQKMHDASGASILKTGELYTFENVKNERVRIDRDLKENGYLYFSPEFILVKADSVSGTHQINANITLKPETPLESKTAYSIRHVFIHDDHMLDGVSADTIEQDSYYLISQNQSLSFGALKDGIFLKPGERYARSNAMHTIRYLNGLPIFRNANLKFVPMELTDQVDVMVFLSQRKRFAYSAEVNTVFKSTNYFGPGLIFSYTDRNANKGAELLKINLNGSFEMQIVEGDFNPAYQLGVEVNYLMPRFYPRFLFNAANKNLPKTNFAVGYNLFNRLDLYRLNSTFANFGYQWSRTDKIQHSFNPLEVIFTALPEDSKSDEFNEYLEENPGVQRSFDEQFILGAAYEFTYDPNARDYSDFFFKGGIDLSGNMLNLLYDATNAPKDSLGRYSLFGVPFSQYVRTRLDMRYSFLFNKRKSLVTRVSAGIGVPLGNSQGLPYVKQFYVGGTNSLRSFIARSVGPGSEVPPEGYNDLTGDIRLEGNLEYRFQLAGSLHAALFIDAGNIWLFKEDASRPSANFQINRFVDQIAISGGWGLRWDFNFIVVRLDFAYTLRTPYLPEGERWIEKFEFWKPATNIAIGYPF